MKFFNEIKTVNSALLFILIVIGGIGIVTYNSVNEIFNSFEAKKSTYSVLTTLEEILTHISLAEEAQRSYFLTKNQTYISPYLSSKSTAKTDINKLKNYFSDDKSQLKKLERLNNFVNERFDFVDNEILKNDSLNVILKNIKSGTSRKYMNEIRTLIGSIKNEEYDLLTAKDEIAAKTIRRTSIIVLVGTLVSGLIFLTVFFILSREILERKKAEEEITQAKDFSERLLNSSIDGIVAYDKDLKFTLWNPGMETLTGIEKSDVLSKNIFEKFPVLKKMGDDVNFYETLKGNFTIVKDRFYSVPNKNKKGYAEAYFSPIYDSEKVVIGGLVIVRDRTSRKLAMEAIERAKRDLEKRVQERTSALSKVNNELRKEIIEREKAQEQMNHSLKEKVILLREIHHRVKNNLQVISSLLNLQSSYIEDKKSLEIFRESQNRVRTMALIHEKLYRSKTLNRIEFDEYINSLAKDLFISYNIKPDRISLISDVSESYLEIDSGILCGLIINELVSNSLKHGFPNGGMGKVFISLHLNPDNKYILSVKDNGIGFPKNIDFKNTESLGLQLVTSLTDQLNGIIELKQNGFTEFEIIFPA